MTAKTNRIDKVVEGIGETAALLESSKELKKLLMPRKQEKFIDMLMAMVGNEALKSPPSRERTELIKLLLKRADQRVHYARLAALKETYRKDKPKKKSGPDLTPEEKQNRISQIFGID